MKIICLFFLAKLLIQIHGKCRMQQECDVMDPQCKPGPADDTDAKILTGAGIVCPEYENKLACCNAGQNILLRNNFLSLDSVFGTEYGGCDACSVNLKKFWCHFTCHPEQDKFMTTNGYEDVVIDNIPYTLLLVNITLNTQMNCQLFNSCKKTKYATQVAAMSNAIGFISFQGTEAYHKSPVFISMNFKNDTGLDFAINPCDTQPVDGKIDGFPVTESCQCNSCGKACKFDTKTVYPILEGFSLITVAVIYASVFISTLLIYLCKTYYRKKHPHFNSRSSSLHTETFEVNSKTQIQSLTMSNNSSNNINNVVSSN